MSVELEIWREACKNIDIQESLSRMTTVLAREFPIGTVAILTLDREALQLTVIASTTDEGATPPGLGRIAVSGDDVENLERLLPAEALVRVARQREALGFLLQEDSESLAGRLSDHDGHDGVLVLTAKPGLTFTPEQEQLAGRLLEPFTIALANDRRLHELNRLREAAEADNRTLRTRLAGPGTMDPIVGAGRGLRTVMEQVDQVAATHVPVLILGETGSGKEVIARAVHERSRRAQGPIVRVNCGAIPPELVDSELFGHERGSFTGAVATRKGWFERADGGTLFLDEIGDLPLAAQVRLLRILQDGTLERVGGQRPLRVDVRIVAATHRDMEAMVAEGRFRADLWYRISVFPMRLPSLRERAEDLPDLVAHFTHRAGVRLGCVALSATEQDLELLAAYHWPGNVRELAAVIDRAVILGHGRRLEISAALGAGGPRPAIVAAPPPTRAASQVARLDQAMVEHIERALAKTGGRIEGPRGAAALLEINPHTLRARMRKLGIDWAAFRQGADDLATGS